MSVFLAVALTLTASAQKQLVLLRKQDVMLRLYPGDEIVLKLKNTKSLKRSYINNLLDQAVVLHRDTVPFNRIERIYFPHGTRLSKLGALLVVGGGLLMAVDQVNNSLIHGNEVSFDEQFTRITLGMIGAGIPLIFIRKKSERISHRRRLLVVGKGSIFYRPDAQNAGWQFRE